MGESFDKSILMFTGSSPDIVSQTDIQRTRLVSHYVDIVGLAHMHTDIINYITFRNQIPPLSFRAERAHSCHFERSTPTLVISSGAQRSREIWLTYVIKPTFSISAEALSLSFRAKHAHSCHFDRSTPTLVISSGARPPLSFRAEHAHSCHFERSAAESRNLANDLNEPTQIHASSHLLLHVFSFSVILHFDF